MGQATSVRQELANSEIMIQKNRQEQRSGQPIFGVGESVIKGYTAIHMYTVVSGTALNSSSSPSGEIITQGTSFLTGYATAATDFAVKV